MKPINRRDFLKAAGVAAAASVVSGCASSRTITARPENVDSINRVGGQPSVIVYGCWPSVKLRRFLQSLKTEPSSPFAAA